jgi:RHS repeat-associated protein
VGDPVDLIRGTGQASRVDLEMTTATGAFSIRRDFSSNGHDWPLELFDRLPKLFGEARTDSYGQLYVSSRFEPRPRWKLNLTALAMLKDQRIQLLDTQGQLHWFQNNASCGTATTNLGAERGESSQLWCLGDNSYLLILPSGQQELYDQFIAGLTRRWFVSRLKTASNQTHASITYAAPRDLNDAPIANCGQETGDQNWTIPFISKVETANQILEFRYTPRILNAGNTCVLARVTARNSDSAAPGAPVVSYAYYVADSLAPLAQAQTSFNSNVRTEAYSLVRDEFPQDGGTTNWVATEMNNSSPIRENHRFTNQLNSQRVATETAPRDSVRIENDGGSQLSVISFHSTGDIPAGQIQKTEVHNILHLPGFGITRNLKTTSCNGSPSCTAGTETWTRPDAGSGVFAFSVQNPVQGRTVTGSSPLNGSTWLPASKHTGVTATQDLTNMNVPASANCKGLECEWYTWQQVGTVGVRMTQTSRPSVLGTGLTTSTKAYDATTGQLKSEIVSGNTKDVTGLVPSETIVTKFVGTFYQTARTTGGHCVSGVDEGGLNRVVEVQGPCFVASASATSCSGVFPVTQYEFYPSTGTDFRRLKKVARFPYGCSVNSTAFSEGIFTLYSNYDVLGRPRTVQEGLHTNGGSEYTSSTDYTYDAEGRVLTRTVQASSFPLDGTKTFTFRSVANRLRSITYPEGNSTRFCYAPTPTSPAGNTSYTCAEGAAGELDVPTAVFKASAATGSFNWSEGVVYAYDALNQNLTSAKFFTAGETTHRREMTVAFDAHQRLTASQTGDGTQPIARRGYWQDELVRAIGHAFNAPPAFCLSGGVVSTNCTAMEYDTALRLNRVLSANGLVESKLLYNQHGEVCDLVTGSASPDCNLATARTKNSVSFEYDDFGNVLAAYLPNTVDGAVKGGTRFRYDAFGNVMLRQNSTQKLAGTSTGYTFDALGRVLSVVNNPATGAAVTLFSYVYDAANTCAGAANFKQTGRLASSTSPFGSTSYSFLGQVTDETVGKTAGCAGANNALATRRRFNLNGDLVKLQYPHGLEVTYNYGTAMQNRSRVESLAVNTDTVGVNRTLVSGIKWEPFGGLRYRKMNTVTPVAGVDVENILGATGFVPTQAQTCPSISAALAGNTKTGRASATFVSSGATLGAGAGDFLKILYSYSGEQMTQYSSCLLNNPVTAQRMQFGYDKALRLTQANGLDFATAGGPHGNLSFTYDGRGNRLTSASNSGSSYNLTYPSGLVPDSLSLASGPTVGTWLTRGYAYDADGRVSRIEWPTNSVTGARYLGFGFQQSGATADSAVKQVVNSPGGFLGSATYEYVYDADNRRRAKVYPSGARAEYFYNNGSEMLEDVNPAIDATAAAVADEYVWLDGQAVAVKRAKFSAAWVKLPESSASCERGEEVAGLVCGWRHVVSDSLGRTVLSLSEAAQIQGVFEYDAFGQMNRMNATGETAHPMASSQTVSVATVQQAPRGHVVEMRLRWSGFDMQTSRRGPFVQVLNSQGAVLDTYSSDFLSAVTLTRWRTDATGTLSVKAFGGFGEPGVAMDGVDYRRYQSGSIPWTHRLRLPGQYYDEETDLSENWNRFYDASTGRYLSPEPLLANPDYVGLMAKNGWPTLSYAYANDNPIKNKDKNGLDPGLLILLGEGLAEAGAADWVASELLTPFILPFIIEPIVGAIFPKPPPVTEADPLDEPTKVKPTTIGGFCPNPVPPKNNCDSIRDLGKAVCLDLALSKGYRNPLNQSPKPIAYQQCICNAQLQYYRCKGQPFPKWLVAACIRVGGFL